MIKMKKAVRTVLRYSADSFNKKTKRRHCYKESAAFLRSKVKAVCLKSQAPT